MLRAKEPFNQFFDDPTLSKAWKTMRKFRQLKKETLCQEHEIRDLADAEERGL